MSLQHSKAKLQVLNSIQHCNMYLLTSISNYLLANKNAPKTTHQFLNWVDIKNIYILAYDNQLADVVDFINTCKQSSISVSVGVIYDGKPELAPKPAFQHQLLSKKQFNWFYIPHDEVVKEINQKPIDVLINLSNHNQLKAKALSKLITATCKIGKFEDTLFDVSIVTENNNRDFLTDVHKYLNMIKTR